MVLIPAWAALESSVEMLSFTIFTSLLLAAIILALLIRQASTTINLMVPYIICIFLSFVWQKYSLYAGFRL